MESCQVADILDNQDLIVKESKLSLSQDAAQSEVLDWKCFICDVHLTNEASNSVFYTILPKSNVLLSNALNKALKTSYAGPDAMRSSVVCNDCFNLLDILEVAEEQCRQLRSSLVSNFTKTCALYDQLVDCADGIACQTDDYTDNGNTSFGDASDDEKPLSQLVVQIKNEDTAMSRPKVKKLKVRMKKKKKREAQEEQDSVDTKEVLSDQSECDNKYSVDEDIADDTDYHTTRVQLSNVKPDPDLVPEVVLTEQKKNKRKKYQCTYHDCERLFRRPGEVKNHILVSHLGKNPNQCTFCSKTFNSRNGLYVHLKRAHQMEYSERKELVSKDYDIELSENLVASYEEKPLTSNATDGEMEEDEEHEKEDDGSDFEWTEETESSPPNRKTRSSKSRRPQSRSNSRRRKEKENLGSNRDIPGAKRKLIKVKCLDDDKICDEIMVKREEEEEVEEEDNYEEGDAEYSVISGGEREEDEGESTDGERRKRKPRTSRAGERIMMPLVHACEQCGKKWRTVSELNAHIKTHSDLRPFVCEICGQGYKLKKALDVHVGMHNGIYPFTCHFCNKSFTQKVGLQKHIPIHTGYSRFQCDLCGKRFIHQKSFQIHKMIHSGEKNIKCNVCGLAVLSSSHLTRHYRVHTGERPYQCTTCGKRFAEKYNLNAHQKIHQPPGADGQKEGTPRKRSSTHKCQLCGFKTTKKASLHAHWESEHKSSMNGATYASSREEMVIPQMTIDPSGSLTYDEKPLADGNARSHSERLGSQSEAKFDPVPSSDDGYRDRILPSIASYRDQERTVPIISEVVASRYSALMPQHLATHAQSGLTHAHHAFGGGALHE